MSRNEGDALRMAGTLQFFRPCSSASLTARQNAFSPTAPLLAADEEPIVLWSAGSLDGIQENS
jgi:hypothetical protein